MRMILDMALAAFFWAEADECDDRNPRPPNPIFTRLTHGQVLSVKHKDYIEAARGHR